MRTFHRWWWLWAGCLGYPVFAAFRDALQGEHGLFAEPVARLAVAALLCSSLIWVRRHPVAVAGVTLAGFLLASQIWPLLVALYVLAVRGRLPTAAAATAAAVLPASQDGFRDLVHMADLTLAPCSFVVVPLACGWAVRSHRDRLDALARQTELRDQQIRSAERERIAREMHDVLAHRLSLMALHTGVLQRRGAEVPEPVRTRLTVLRTTSTEALEDLRDLLGALRDTEAAGAPRRPAGEDLPGLVADAEAAGTRVVRDIDDLDALPASLRLAVHRIVQEALTNARKHAPGSPVDLSVSVGRRAVVVHVENDAPPGPGQAPSGYGLLGVAERVTALHGRLTTGRSDAGRFTVHAELPLAAEQPRPCRPAPSDGSLVPAGGAG